MITDEQIKQGLDKAYKEAGHNAYFGNGFEAGVKFALEQVKKINYDAVLPIVFEPGDVIMFCDEHYFVIENNGANGVVAPFRETCYLNTFWWELGDDKCTFVRKATERELSMLGLNCG